MKTNKKRTKRQVRIAEEAGIYRVSSRSRDSEGESHVGAKRGRKPLGGLRIILRLTPQEVLVLDEKHKQTGHSRTDLIRRAIDAFYFSKRRESDWETPPKADR